MFPLRQEGLILGLRVGASHPGLYGLQGKQWGGGGGGGGLCGSGIPVPDGSGGPATHGTDSHGSPCVSDHTHRLCV